MKRQRHATVGTSDSTARPVVIGLQAAPVKADPADAAPRSADSGPAGRVWAKYIDSRLKQFGTR